MYVERAKANGIGYLDPSRLQPNLATVSWGLTSIFDPTVNDPAATVATPPFVRAAAGPIHTPHACQRARHFPSAWRVSGDASRS